MLLLSDRRKVRLQQAQGAGRRDHISAAAAGAPSITRAFAAADPRGDIQMELQRLSLFGDAGGNVKEELLEAVNLVGLFRLLLLQGLDEAVVAAALRLLFGVLLLERGQLLRHAADLRLVVHDLVHDGPRLDLLRAGGELECAPRLLQETFGRGRAADDGHASVPRQARLQDARELAVAVIHVRVSRLREGLDHAAERQQALVDHAALLLPDAGRASVSNTLGTSEVDQVERRDKGGLVDFFGRRVDVLVEHLLALQHDAENGVGSAGPAVHLRAPHVAVPLAHLQDLQNGLEVPHGLLVSVDVHAFPRVFAHLLKYRRERGFRVQSIE